MLICMNLVDFQSLRNGLQINAVPATAQVRGTFEVALREELLATGAFTDVEVGTTDEKDHLLVVLANHAAGLTEHEVSLAVEWAWSAVAFHHWQANGLLVEDGHVEFQAATLDRPGGRYLTLHLVSQRAEVAEPVPAGHTSLLSAQRMAHAPAAARAYAHSA
jgi:hypothetical protein